MAPSSCVDTAAATLRASVSADWLNYVRGSHQGIPCWHSVKQAQRRWGSGNGGRRRMSLEAASHDPARWRPRCDGRLVIDNVKTEAYHIFNLQWPRSSAVISQLLVLIPAIFICRSQRHRQLGSVVGSIREATIAVRHIRAHQHAAKVKVTMQRRSGRNLYTRRHSAPVEDSEYEEYDDDLPQSPAMHMFKELWMQVAVVVVMACGVVIAFNAGISVKALILILVASLCCYIFVTLFVPSHVTTVVANGIGTAADEAGTVIVSSFARALLLFMSAMVETAKVIALANFEIFNKMKNIIVIVPMVVWLTIIGSPIAKELLVPSNGHHVDERIERTPSRVRRTLRPNRREADGEGERVRGRSMERWREERKRGGGEGKRHRERGERVDTPPLGSFNHVSR
ncbi:hypothetical protein LSAT2_003958 [Lamellibrachia satsuma]|nr:hypothetical protein LSAT2_003958 [Lamellibrachia satsuma]